MKKLLKFLGGLLLLILLSGGLLYLFISESLPTGEQGSEADELAQRMMTSLQKEAFDNTEVLQWSFRGEHNYTWYKQEGKVAVTWENNFVKLNLNDISKSESDKPENIKNALDFFNNDSFWLVAPYKVFDEGTERRIVKVDGKDALLVTYTSGGTTPGDSYLWFLDENFKPTKFKMWTKIIPIGGVEATWNNFKKTESGVYLPQSHSLSLFGLEIDMGDVKAYNPNADALANKVLKAINHEAYKNTRYIDWSFRGARFFKWDKQEHVVEVKWGKNKVILHPDNLKESIAYVNNEEVDDAERIIKRAWDIFNNDSFWLVAPHKLFEPGIIRNIEMIDGKEALRVKYTTGGSTPGDAYVWILDENYIPKSYKMYVPSMKMNGLLATWEDWTKMKSGTLLPKMHTIGKNKLSMGDLKAYN